MNRHSDILLTVLIPFEESKEIVSNYTFTHVWLS